MPERRPRADRAQQFMPFRRAQRLLRPIRERERVAEPKRELTDEQALELSRKLSQLKRREMACIVHYDGEAYVTARGLVSDIDLAARTVTVVRTRIPSTTSRTSGRTRDASSPEKHARRPFCVFFGR